MTIEPARRVALACFAHPDDAEILCGGTLIRLRRLGWTIHIATATAGDCGSSTLSADEIAALRREEARKAAAMIDAQYHCLEFLDARVCYDRDSIDRTIDLFRTVGPSLVFTHPRQVYLMDHEQTHLLVRCAAFAGPIRNASALPQVPGARIPHLYYTDPMGGRDAYTGEATPRPTTCIDISSVIEPKLVMLACHRSQREWLRDHHGTDEYLDATREHAASRGREIGVDYAEAFNQHRGHAYPQDDLLALLLQESEN